MSIHRDDPQDRPGDQFQDGTIASDDLHDAEIVALFQAEAHRLKGYLAGLGADWSIIDDIIQDSFLATRRRWPDVRGYKYPKAYLYKVATNRMRRLHRDRYLWAEPHADPGQAAGHSAPEDPGQPAAIEAAISQLPRRQREAILLHCVYGFSVIETAEILQISEGSVKNYLCLGRRKLAELLKISPETWERE